jgi:hypothetical protein
MSVPIAAIRGGKGLQSAPVGGGGGAPMLADLVDYSEYWPLNQDTFLTGNNGTMMNDDGTSIGLAAWDGPELALSFDEFTYTLVAGVAAINLGQELTIAFWIQPSSSITDANIMFKNGPGIGHVEYLVEFVGGCIRFVAGTGSSNYVALGATSVCDDGKHLVVITRNASNFVTLYIDGAVDGSAAGTGFYSANNELDFNGDFATFLLRGLGLYNRAWSAGEVTAYYNGGDSVLLTAP